MRTILLSTALCFVGVSLVGLAGCSGKATSTMSASQTGEHAHTHAHGHEHGGAHAHGPHGGHIIDLGTDEYRAELLFDDKTPTVGIYLLGADMGTAVAIDAPSVKIHASADGKSTEYALLAVPQSGESEGKSSYFELSSEPLHAIMAGTSPSPNTRTRLSVLIDGLPFAGEISGSAADESLIWAKHLTEGDFAIALGHHGAQLTAGNGVEPAVQITRNGQPVDNAKVFNALLNTEGDVFSVEVPTVYEPPSDAEPAHYAQGMLRIPQGTHDAVIRFRIVLPDNKGEHKYDLPITVR